MNTLECHVVEVVSLLSLLEKLLAFGLIYMVFVQKGDFP